MLEGADLSEEIKEEWLPEVISNVVAEYTAGRRARTSGISTGSSPRWTRSTAPASRPRSCAGLDREAIVEEFLDDALDAYAEREKEIEGIQEGLMRDLERYIVLQVVDIRWREHLENMDYMREGIHLRGMAQKDPLVEYRNEGHMMFLELNRVDPRGGRHAPLPRAGRGRPGRRASGAAAAGRCPGGTAAAERQPQLRAPVARRRRGDRRRRRHVDGRDGAAAGGGTGRDRSRSSSPTHENIGRNDPCWCGSGKKFKRCHGA